jgi:hypothetical protein
MEDGHDLALKNLADDLSLLEQHAKRIVSLLGRQIGWRRGKGRGATSLKWSVPRERAIPFAKWPG